MDSSNNIKTIVMLGKPGSGKGTQAELLSEKTGWRLHSNGARFREIRQEESYLGQRVREEYDAGLLLPHWFASRLNQDLFLALSLEEGVICEGTGRTLGESQNFDEVMKWLKRPYRAVNLNVDEDAVIERIRKRSEELGRPDDEPEAMKIRFKEYEKLTAPAIDFFRQSGNLVEIDGMRTPEEVHADILKELNL